MEKPQQRASSNQASPNTTRKYTAQETIEIYTDWANHYLEKARSKKRIHDLQTDISDGVVLCDIIEAVTNQKIPDINRKPKTSSQMLENVSVCLSLLESLGVATEGVTARDVREGSLKSILGLFFALSRFKQRQRRELQQKQLQEAIMPRLPSPFNKHGATSIPVPASVAARRGTTPIGKSGGASRPSSPGIGPGNVSVNCTGGGGGVVTSLIPTPRSASRTDKPTNQIKSATGTGARSLRPPSYTSSGSTNVMMNHSGSGQSTLERGMKHPQNVIHSNKNVPSSGAATTTSNATPSSVLDKFKFFNSPPRSTKQGPAGSKRTSSSSGFSSARSERSDSSASINSDARLPQGYVLPMSPPSPQDSSRNQHKNKATKVHVNSPRNSRKAAKKTPSYNNLTTEHDLQNSRDSSNSRYVESLSPKTDMKSNHRSKMNIEASSSIPKPTAAVKGTTKVMPDKIKSTNGAADSYLRKPLKESVALVCPMPLISESTSPAVSSPPGVQVSMFAKGVRPGETPSPTQAPPSSAQQQCVGVTIGASDTLHVREFDLHHQQQPQHQPTNILADKGVPGETLQVTTDTVNTAVDDEEAGMRVKPMQPLSYVRPGIFNGDRQRTCFMPEILRLSRRNGTFLSGSHFADLDMAAGYLSDGEVLRGGGSSGSLLEPADGYLSEGAASLYMRRAMRDSLDDDSSSLSSEVSEPLNELSEERHLEKKRLPDNNICETQINGYTNSPGGPGGELDSSGPHQHHHHHQQQQQQGLRPVLKVVSSRQLVKKADSSQQTESSAFRQGNHWKRYPIPEGGNGGSSGGSGKPSLESRPELRRGKSDLGEQREKSREKNRDRVDKLQQERAAAVVNGGGSSRSHQGERSRRSQGTKEEERRSSSRGSQGGSSSKGSGGGVTLQQQSSGSEASSPGSNRPRGGGNGNNSHHVRVPASFGYVSKRANSNVSVCSNRSHTSSSANGKANDDLSRTAQVSAVPRNSESNTNSGQRPRHSKVKISGGTQTTSSDINPSPVEYNTTPSPSRRGSSSSYKSYSLTAPTASQLSANVRERLLLVGGNSHSLPKASNAANTSLPNEYAHALFASSPRTGPRAGARFTDGSLSDTTGYSNYSELTGNTGGNSGNGYYGVPGVGSPYSWLRHSSTYNASIATARCNVANSSLTESTDSLSSLGSQHRTSLSHARILMHPRDGSPGPRLNRSNSIRSTKSEKLYPSMLQRSEDLLLDSYYNSVLSASTTGPSQTMHRPVPDSQASQPTSPTPSQGNNRFNFPLSSSASSHGLSRPTTMSPYLISSKISCKDDEMHGSSLSLVSTASSLYSTAEEKQAHEIRKLRRELMEAQDKVHTLTNQLSTNAHVVSAFEQSLSNMTQRLQQLTASAEKKDSELLELRQTIDLLRQHSMDAGLTQLQQGGNMARQLSTDSVSSLSSACSGASHVSGRRGIPGGTSSKKKKGWLRSSFSKAFSRTKKSRHGSLSLSDIEDGRTPGSELSAPSSPMLQSHKHHSLALASAQLNNDALKLSHSSSAIYGQEIEGNGPEVVHELRKQLREKDLVLTDIRLEALSSAHQLESLKDTVLKMRNEMMTLKQDNERLQRIVTSKSLTSSQSSLPITDSLERRFSMSDTPALATLECTTVHGDPDGRLVGVAVLLGGKHVCGAANVNELGEDGAEWRVANIGVGGKMQWEALDSLVRRVFKEYVLRVDPVSNLGLSADSVYAYHVGEITRVLSEGLPKTPELLPYGYLIGEEISIKICVKTAQHSGSVDAMAFETLIPKSIVQRYVSLLSEHRRIILCGPSGTGKSFLANKLAQYLVLRDNREPTPEVIATFNVDHKSSKELRQYLANIAEQCENNASDLPSVIILDNLHNAGSLGEIFNGFLNTKYTKCPYIIGTMNQATCSTTNLQLHHNFRWVLCANHMEPVKGFLARFLKRRLMETEIKNIQRNPELARIFEWIPKVWNHLNKFLETHSSSDVTIGPRLFLSCPAELAGSQVWFTDLWNYSVVPYLLEAVREGLQLYGRRGAWEDPTRFITQTYPWSAEAVHGGADALIRLRPEDVGYDIQATLASASTSPPGPGGNLQAHAAPNTDNEGDPLLNMLMRLQEAANYSSPHDGMDSSDSANSGERDSRETDREGEQDVEDHEGE